MIGLFLFLSACKKIESAPADTIDARVNEKMTQYETQLASSEFGWKGYLLTGRNNAVKFTFNFNNKNRVVMSSSYRTGTPESSYRLKALQLPTLIFDSYSLLHLISDPDPTVLRGGPGSGYQSDFEFGIVSASADTIHLVGLSNKCKLTLIRATSNTTIQSINDEYSALESNFTKFRTYFKQVKIGESNCEVNLNTDTRMFSLQFMDGKTLKTTSSKYYVSGTTILFFTPLEVGKIKINSLNGVNFNTASGFLSAQLNGTEVQIKEAVAPIQYNKDDAAKFLLPHEGYFGPTGTWINYTGFTEDAIIDNYGIRKSGIFYSYFNVTDDGVDPKGTFSNLSGYSSMVESTMSANGILFNRLIAINGTNNNAAQKAAIDQTYVTFTDPNGFYVIPVGDKYDLVSFGDARKWINFQ